MNESPLSAGTAAVQRVIDHLAARQHPHAPRMLDDAARTAQQAADALGVTLGQIAKSIVFRRKPDGVAVLVVTSGDLRVDENKVQALVCVDGGKLGRADAEFVKSSTGFSIGGVSPLGHTTPVVTLIDAQLYRFEEIWAAAGHPHAVFRLSPPPAPEPDRCPRARRHRGRSAPTNMTSSNRPPVTLQAARAKVGAVPGVPSPCISVCEMDEATHSCKGCFRTLAEISQWSRMGDADKLVVWQQIEARQVPVSAP